MANVHQLTADLQKELGQWDEARWKQAIFLEPHPVYPTYLAVNSSNPVYAHDLKDVIGEYKAVSYLKLDKLYEACDAAGYGDVVFIKDPEQVFHWLDTLDAPYPSSLNVELKKFQLQGFNLTKDLPGALIVWSTGTGKSVYGVARAKYLLEHDLVDKVVVVAKAHNKINWQRQFKSIGNLDASVPIGSGATANKKREVRAEEYKDSQIFIINYEKLRYSDGNISGDGQDLAKALKKQRVFWIWDEMPTKMKSMATMHYRGAQKILRATKQNYQVMLSATPIERVPEDIYSCLKLVAPGTFTSKQKFRQMYAKSFSTFSPWQVATWDLAKLRELGMRLAPVTHQANKYRDPEIRAEFPQDHWEDVIVDMSAQDRVLYQTAATAVIKDLPMEFNSLLTKGNVLQMICNNPDLINKSTGKLAVELSQLYKFTDANSAKLEKLKDLLDEIDGKVVLFTMFNDFGVKMLAPYLTNWGHNYVIYDGNEKQKQLAQDRFRDDTRIKVFLSSDQGSDSINLEQATSVINYDLPWNYSTLIQRVNRIHRITSEAEHVFYYNLITADTMEERKVTILNRKRNYDEAIFADIAHQSEILATTTLADLKYIITGSY